MASFWSKMFIVFMAYFSSQVLAASMHEQFATIAAAPAFLPDAPLSSPPPTSISTLSPDIEPEFPTPISMAPSPSDLSMPTIPSSPSPPNPDAIMPASGPGLASSPSEPLPASSSFALFSSGSLQVMGLLLFCFMLFSGM